MSKNEEGGGAVTDRADKEEVERAGSNATGLPEQMKRRAEAESGFTFDDVRVHYGSARPAQVGALAYARGNQVYLGPGQEQYLGHELGHVVQQKQGRVAPTGQVKGQPLNDDRRLEMEADRMGRLFGR